MEDRSGVGCDIVAFIRQAARGCGTALNRCPPDGHPTVHLKQARTLGQAILPARAKNGSQLFDCCMGEHPRAQRGRLVPPSGYHPGSESRLLKVWLPSIAP